MALADYRPDAMRCTRCSYCKWIPFDLVKSARFAKGCPSIEAGKFHAYSAGGRLITALSLMDGRSEVGDAVVDVAFRCQLCGNCDVTCKLCRYDMEPLAALHELRAHLVALDRVPDSYRPLIEKVRAGNRGEGRSAAARIAWAEGLGLKDATAAPVDVVFFAGCTYSLEEPLRGTVRTQARLLQAAGVKAGLLPETGCCGGLAYRMGYREEFAEAAKRMLAAWAAAGVKTVVTPCADCYHTFTRLYPELDGAAAGMPEILHTVELVARLVKEGRLALTTPLPLTVTYHDPCHLGRQGEPYLPWHGVETKIYGQAVIYEPPRPRYNGARGVYDPPRELLRAIPGLEVVEMERNREAALCCGAGGACREAFPAYSAWVAAERLTEAAASGAEAIVSACSRCELNFSEGVAAAAAAGDGSHAAGRDSATAALEVYDLLELVARAAGQGEEAR
jgi:Fe-S oxidoreductase